MDKKKSHKNLIIILIVIALLILIGCFNGYRWYKNYQEEQARIMAENIARVDEVTADNLNIEYNTEPTNENVKLTLSTTSEYEITYFVETDENESKYIKYNEQIIVENNSKIYVKYLNSYGTYSKEPYIIEITNIDKELPTIVNKEATVTTNSLSVNITAEDNLEVNKIEVSIDNENYNELQEGKYTFEGLNEATEYTVKIRVTDVAGNVANDELTKTTEKTKTENKVNVTKTNTTDKSKTSNTSNSTNNSNTAKTTDDYVYNDSIEYLLPKAQENMSKYKSQIQEVLGYVNQYRAEVGADPLTLDETLTKAAMVRALDISYGGKVAHTRPNGDSYEKVLADFQIYYAPRGENIVYNTTVKNGVVWWRNSEGHYANMIKKDYVRIGIGISYYNGYYYMVQLFCGDW